MFQLALLIGSYSLIIFFIGILSFLNKGFILFTTILYTALVFFVFRKTLFQFRKQVQKLDPKKLLTTIKNNKLTTFLSLLILVQAVINLIGALGPELAFDALWYHLSMPKIYLQAGRIFYIGGHLYYSAMPQLTEMFYLVSIALGNEIIAKLIHFLFGILSLIALYKIARIFFTVQNSILAGLIFYSNMVVSWMSMTAYIDLARTFFEAMALWAFLIFTKSQKIKWLSLSAAMVGFAASSKNLSLGSIALYLLLLAYLKFSKKIKTESFLKLAAVYTGIVSLIVSPWLLFSYFNTGNPVFPIFFTPSYQASPIPSNLTQFLDKAVQIFITPSDPISPIYAISVPLIVLFFWKSWFRRDSNKTTFIMRLLTIYILFYVSTLYLTPIESSSRFILPYLPAFTLLFLFMLNNLKNKFLKSFLFMVILLIAISSIAYRGIANKRFIPYLLGRMTLSKFMSRNMEFEVGNFYDVDKYFQKTLTQKDRVLIYGVSNLYFVNFPYVHESWAKKGDMFNYILIKHDNPLPERFKDWRLIYKNPLVRVRLYSAGGSFSTF